MEVFSAKGSSLLFGLVIKFLLHAFLQLSSSGEIISKNHTARKRVKIELKTEFKTVGRGGGSTFKHPSPPLGLPGTLRPTPHTPQANWQNQIGTLFWTARRERASLGATAERAPFLDPASQNSFRQDLQHTFPAGSGGIDQRDWHKMVFRLLDFKT